AATPFLNTSATYARRSADIPTCSGVASGNGAARRPPAAASTDTDATARAQARIESFMSDFSPKRLSCLTTVHRIVLHCVMPSSLEQSAAADSPAKSNPDGRLADARSSTNPARAVLLFRNVTGA